MLVDNLVAQVVDGKVEITDPDGFKLASLEPGGKPKQFHYKGKDYWAQWKNEHQVQVQVSVAEENRWLGWGEIWLSQ